ncbi:hypothetical protein [Actinomadura sp. 7K507]|uniref:hypothetical protein n=1 Tax=Actinomadura sp. 7K507 TaxID=2530365 RepID=UPI001051793F|nr:hypothetical protein [Actinomadura sp. 7K507]TDC78306.1 hypothetical protein E1285_37590 [Actinomadura sp. 7K507]
MLGVYADLPWSYAAGAGIALAAAHQLRGAGPPPRPARGVTGRYLLLAMAYGAVVFVPASLLVAHRYPQWATLQYGDGVPLARLAAAELALTAAGFLVTRLLLAAGRTRWAASQVIFGCLVMCVAVVHGPDGDGWKRFLSRDRAAFADFPEFQTVADAGAIAGHAAVFLTSGLAVTLYLTGAVTLGVLGLIMGVLHQFGLTDAGADGPGPLRAAFAAAVTGAGVAAVAALVSLLVHGVGWVAAAAVAPVLLVAVAARGAYATVLIDDLALPADHPTDE